MLKPVVTGSADVRCVQEVFIKILRNSASVNLDSADVNLSAHSMVASHQFENCHRKSTPSVHILDAGYPHGWLLQLIEPVGKIARLHRVSYQQKQS